MTKSWYEKLHNAAKDSPEYRACMEELIMEKDIFMKSKLIKVDTLNSSIYLNPDHIESIRTAEEEESQTERCVIVMSSGCRVWAIDSIADVIASINEAQE